MRASWPRTQWRSLLLAFALSLAAHVVVLSTLAPKRAGDAREPLLTVTLVGAFATSPPPTPDAVHASPAAPAATPPSPKPPAQVERHVERMAVAAPQGAAGANAKPTAPQAAPPPVPALAPPVRPALQRADQERAFEAADTLDALPAPVSSPDIGDVGRKVVGRRLQVSVWVESDGTVQKAFVKRNEISDDVARLLEQAVASVRFTPGRRDGKPVPSVLDARLCFDDAGVLDIHSAECLRPGVAPSAEEAASPAR
jgi:hypothetical protein